MIGDPPNIIIASKAGLDFNEFLLHMAPLCVAALAVVIPMMLFFFRTQLTNTVEDRAEVLKLIPASFISDRKLMVKSLAVLTIVIVGFILHTVMHLEPSLIAMMGAGLLVLISGLKPAEFAMDVEWGTLVFFAGLFIMVGALVNVGLGPVDRRGREVPEPSQRRHARPLERSSVVRQHRVDALERRHRREDVRDRGQMAIDEVI